MAGRPRGPLSDLAEVKRMIDEWSSAAKEIKAADIELCV
jgi:hypothetical protein